MNPLPKELYSALKFNLLFVGIGPKSLSEYHELKPLHPRPAFQPLSLDALRAQSSLENKCQRNRRETLGSQPESRFSFTEGFPQLLLDGGKIRGLPVGVIDAF
jgi:hypothetical protein